jgi:hypothetical protein
MAFKVVNKIIVHRKKWGWTIFLPSSNHSRFGQQDWYGVSCCAHQSQTKHDFSIVE